MCDFCDEVKALPQKKALVAIGRAMERATPKGKAHLSDLLDEVLGIETTESDPELDEAWEKNRDGE